MDFNSIVFPRPNLDFSIISLFKDELIFIPKFKDKVEYIPCLFLRDPKNDTNNFIIMFHGNAEDIFGAKEMGDSLCYKFQMNVIIVEYPGYSIYNSEANSEDILSNTTIVYDFIKGKFKLSDKNIFIFGRSIGTAPAIYLASVRKPNALFVVSAFTSIKSVADNLVGILKILVKERLTSIEYIKKVKCPILFIHGQSDTLIPFKETILLKDNCDCPFEVVLPINMTHNDFDIDDDIIEPINKFMYRHCNIDKTESFFDENLISELYKMPKMIKMYIQDKYKNS